MKKEEKPHLVKDEKTLCGKTKWKGGNDIRFAPEYCFDDDFEYTCDKCLKAYKKI